MTDKPEKSKTPLTDALSARHRKFVLEYMVDLNQTKAAIRAGFAEASARQQASVLMTKHNICAAIAEQLDVNVGVTRNWIVAELAKIAGANAEDVLSFGPDGVTLRDSEELPREIMAAVSGASSVATKYGRSISIKMHDKLGALNSLKEIAGLSRSRVEHTGKDGEKLEPGALGGAVFVRAPVASRSDWEAQMKLDQEEQRRNDEAAIQAAKQRK